MTTSSEAPSNNTAAAQGTAEDVEDPPHPGSTTYKRSEKSSSLLTWALALFGTAVGAGILFLPISAGSFGFWPLLIMTVFIGPLVFFSHRTFSRIVTISGSRGLDILEVVTEYTGRKRGFATALIYWFAIYPTVLIYGISITNTIDSFIVNQLNGPQINRVLLSIVCVGVMTLAFALGKKAVLWLSNALVYPLALSLLAVSLYLIPRWDIASFMEFKSETALVPSLLLMLPVLVFSFSHMAAISQLALDIQKSHADYVERRVSRIDLVACIMLVAFTMFFVWSSALALGADGMEEALEQNIPILSYFANVTNTQFMAFLAPVVTICAIVTSYFGHMLGTEEGVKYIVRVAAPHKVDSISDKAFSYGVYIFVFITATLTSIFNPSILNIISVLGGVVFGFLVNMMPMLLFLKVKRLRPWATKPETIFVFIMGVILVATTAWSNFF